ncbi:hypothetical protein [Thiomicrospira microaerophila]|uniref:hypothetical protein n=1 Tax=Thiomicrospira microaerophila TaxID=406020 RepID=UPI0005C88089|nr:hypothetical protein [Thiomicrospira microaerophila]
MQTNNQPLYIMTPQPVGRFAPCSSTLFIKSLIEKHSETRFTDMNLREDQRKPTYNRLGYRFGFVDNQQKQHYYYYFLERALNGELFGSKRSYSLQHATTTLIAKGLLLTENNSALTLTPFPTETGKPAFCYAVSSEILSYGNEIYNIQQHTPVCVTPPKPISNGFEDL